MSSSIGFELDAQQRANAVMKAEPTKAVDTAERALRSLIKAWDALPGGKYHSPWEVEEWLKKDMAPAVSRGRKVLGEALKP
jgi:hypothetical protein